MSSVDRTQLQKSMTHYAQYTVLIGLRIIFGTTTLLTLSVQVQPLFYVGL